MTLWISLVPSYDAPLSAFSDDTISVHTDMSDDDQFVVLDNSEPSMFDEIFPPNKDRSLISHAADVAEEACEVPPSTNYQQIDLISKQLQRKVYTVVYICATPLSPLLNSFCNIEIKTSFQFNTIVTHFDLIEKL